MKFLLRSYVPDSAAVLLLHTLGGGVRHVASVLLQIEELQLEVLEGGSVMLNGFYVVGKGTNSVVYRCRPRLGGFDLACKIRRGDSTRPSLAQEGQLLHIANSVGVGPRLYTYGRDVIAYRYVDGVPLERWWGGAGSQQRRDLVEDLLTQAFRLDAAGVSHNELSRLERHVIVEGGRPVIIDFESATLGGGRNVTQVANGLMRLGLKPPVDALRRYKSCMCRDALDEVLRGFLSQL
ncbi:MAG: serine/threonine protein kinase [Pyrobaculum sp.]